MTPHRAASERSWGWFVALFFAFLVGGVLLLDLSLVQAFVVSPWTRFNAWLSAESLSAVGIHSVATGTVVRSGSANLEILEGCNGAHALLILISAIWAYPATWKRRLAGTAVGVVVVLGANLVRLTNLIVVARYHPAHLETFHVYVWQTLIILVAFAVFLLWGTYFAHAAPRSHDDSVE